MQIVQSCFCAQSVQNSEVQSSEVQSKAWLLCAHRTWQTRSCYNAGHYLRTTEAWNQASKIWSQQRLGSDLKRHGWLGSMPKCAHRCLKSLTNAKMCSQYLFWSCLPMPCTSSDHTCIWRRRRKLQAIFRAMGDTWGQCLGCQCDDVRPPGWHLPISHAQQRAV